jgi:ribosomal protein S18 acetylase RimI-like enzyme
MMAVSEGGTKVAIRGATSKDAPGILECLSAAFAEYRQAYAPSAFLDTVLTPETIEERLAKMAVFVAVNDSNQVIGTIACQVVGQDEGHLRGMAVLPAWHGAGVASQLLQRGESELRSKNCTKVTLDTTAPLTRAMRFYERNGYRRSGKIADFFGMPLFEYHKSLRS